MGKPNFSLFIGWDFEEHRLPGSEIDKLPDNLRSLFTTHKFIEPEDLVFDGLQFEEFHWGRDDTDDPGPSAGVGIFIHRAWWDSGVTALDFETIHLKITDTLSRLAPLLEKWGIKKKPYVLEFPHYGA